MSSSRKTPTLAQCLARSESREFQQRLEQARYYAGIDLGTSNSSVALVDALALLRGDTEEAVRVLPVRQHSSQGVRENPLLPSVVAEVEPGEWWVGEGAREARSRGLLRGRQIFYSTKLEMGLGREPFYPQATSEVYDCPHKVAGRILDELGHAIEYEVGLETLERVVVTVPASFQLAARKDTKRAASLALMDLQEQSLLDEPNAAFLDYILTCRPRTDEGWHFNFSLFLERHGRADEALELVEKVVEISPGDGVYRAWRAILWHREGREAEAREELQQAARDLDAESRLDSCQRYWRARVARELGDTTTAARLERETDVPETPSVGYDESRLPGHTGTLARRAS